MVTIGGSDKNRGKVGKEGGVANVGGDGVRHGLLALSVFQSFKVLNSDNKAPEESRVSVHTATSPSILLKKSSETCPSTGL